MIGLGSDKNTKHALCLYHIDNSHYTDFILKFVGTLRKFSYNACCIFDHLARGAALLSIHARWMSAILHHSHQSKLTEMILDLRTHLFPYLEVSRLIFTLNKTGLGWWFDLMQTWDLSHWIFKWIFTENLFWEKLPQNLSKWIFTYHSGEEKRSNWGKLPRHSKERSLGPSVMTEVWRKERCW